MLRRFFGPPLRSSAPLASGLLGCASAIAPAPPAAAAAASPASLSRAPFGRG